MWPNWPIRSASGKLAKNRRWKSPTGKVQPTAPTPSDARRPARAGVKRSYFEKEKATSSHGEWLAWEEPRAVGDLVHVEKFFARNLGGLIHARSRVPGRLGKATSRTPFGHTKIESTVRYLGIELDDALGIAEQIDV